MRTKTVQYADRMLDAAARLFGVRRFHEVRMEDIAAEAAVSKGTLYRYFQDKNHMYLALLERASRQLLQRLQERVDRADGPRRQLMAFVAAAIAFFDAQPHVFDLIQRAEVMPTPPAGFSWQQVRDQGLRMVQDIFAEGQKRGTLRVRDPELAALMLLGGLRAVIRFGRRPRPSHLPARLVDAFLRGADITNSRQSRLRLV